MQQTRWCTLLLMLLLLPEVSAWAARLGSGQELSGRHCLVAA
jgi:hypothetical protein